MGEAHNIEKRTGGGNAAARSLKSVIIEEENGLVTVTIRIFDHI